MKKQISKKQSLKKSTKKTSKKKDKVNIQITFFLITLAAILISFFAFSYIFNKTRDPCFDYNGFKACPVVLEGTNIIFYSIPVNFKVAGLEQQNNVVIKTDPRKIEEMNIPINVPEFFLKTRPLYLFVTMSPESNSKTIEAAFEITKFAGNLQIKGLMAFTEDVGHNNTNIITCEEATNANRVIWLKYLSDSNESIDGRLSSISLANANPNCIIIESNSYEGLIEASDAFVLEWLLRITDKK